MDIVVITEPTSSNPDSCSCPSINENGSFVQPNVSHIKQIIPPKANMSNGLVESSSSAVPLDDNNSKELSSSASANEYHFREDNVVVPTEGPDPVGLISSSEQSCCSTSGSDFHGSSLPFTDSNNPSSSDQHSFPSFSSENNHVNGQNVSSLSWTDSTSSVAVSDTDEDTFVPKASSSPNGVLDSSSLSEKNNHQEKLTDTSGAAASQIINSTYLVSNTPMILSSRNMNKHSEVTSTTQGENEDQTRMNSTFLMPNIPIQTLHRQQDLANNGSSNSSEMNITFSTHNNNNVAKNINAFQQQLGTVDESDDNNTKNDDASNGCSTTTIESSIEISEAVSSTVQELNVVNNMDSPIPNSNGVVASPSSSSSSLPLTPRRAKKHYAPGPIPKNLLDQSQRKTQLNNEKKALCSSSDSEDSSSANLSLRKKAPCKPKPKLKRGRESRADREALLDTANPKPSTSFALQRELKRIHNGNNNNVNKVNGSTSSTISSSGPHFNNNLTVETKISSENEVKEGDGKGLSGVDAVFHLYGRASTLPNKNNSNNEERTKQPLEEDDKESEPRVGKMSNNDNNSLLLNEAKEAGNTAVAAPNHPQQSRRLRFQDASNNPEKIEQQGQEEPNVTKSQRRGRSTVAKATVEPTTPPSLYHSIGHEAISASTEEEEELPVQEEVQPESLPTRKRNGQKSDKIEIVRKESPLEQDQGEEEESVPTRKRRKPASSSTFEMPTTTVIKTRSRRGVKTVVEEEEEPIGSQSEQLLQSSTHSKSQRELFKPQPSESTTTKKTTRSTSKSKSTTTTTTRASVMEDEDLQQSEPPKTSRKRPSSSQVVDNLSTTENTKITADSGRRPAMPPPSSSNVSPLDEPLGLRRSGRSRKVRDFGDGFVPYF